MVTTDVALHDTRDPSILSSWYYLCDIKPLLTNENPDEKLLSTLCKT